MTLVIVSTTDDGIVAVGDSAASTEEHGATGAAKVQFHEGRRIAFALWGDAVLGPEGAKVQIDHVLGEFIRTAAVVSSDTVGDVADMLASDVRRPLEQYRARKIGAGRKVSWGMVHFGTFVAGYDDDGEPTVQHATCGILAADSGPPRVVRPAIDDTARPDGVRARHWYGGTPPDRAAAKEAFQIVSRRTGDASYRADLVLAEYAFLKEVVVETARLCSRSQRIPSVNDDVHGIGFNQREILVDTRCELRDWLSEFEPGRSRGDGARPRS